MATSGRMLTGSLLRFQGRDGQFIRYFVATGWCTVKAEQKPQQTGAKICRLFSFGDVANLSLNFNALKLSVKPYSHSRKWHCLGEHAMHDSPADDMHDAQGAVAQLLQELGVSKEDAVGISSKAPVYIRELVDAVHELDDAHLWSSWQGESGGSAIEHDTFRNKILQIARTKRDMGIFPFLESIGVNPLSTRHISRYLSAEPLTCLIQKIDFFKELFSPANFEGRNISYMIRHMMMQLSVSADDNLQQSLSFFEKAGICSKDVGKMLLRYPWLLSKCIVDNVDNITLYFAAEKVPKKNVVRGITRCPQLLGYSPDKLKSVLNQINGLGIKSKTLDRITAFSPQLLLRRSQDFIKMWDPTGEHWDDGDVGPTRPLGLAPEARREGQDAVVLALAPLLGDTVETVARNLEGLLAGVPDYQGIEEVPIPSQIHTVRVELPMHRLLRRVARAVACYREHNLP